MARCKPREWYKERNIAEYLGGWMKIGRCIDENLERHLKLEFHDYNPQQLQHFCNQARDTLMYSETLAVMQFITGFTVMMLGCRQPAPALRLLDYNKTVHDGNFFYLHVSDVLVAIMCLVFIISVIWMTCSTLFIYGTLQTKPNYIVTYFLYGFAMCIMFLGIALLEVVGELFFVGVGTFTFTVFYMKCLKNVYTVYEKMQREKPQDEQLLVTEEDFSVEA